MKKIFSVLVFLMATHFSIAQDQIIDHRDFSQAQVFYEKGKSFFDFAAYDSAAIYFSKAIALNPNNSDYFFGRASSFNNLGDLEKAAKDIAIAIEMEPDQPDYHYFGANIFFKTKKYQAAAENYTRAISNQGNNDVNINLVNCYYNRGVSYLVMDVYNKAAEDFSMVIKLNNSFAQAYHNRGVALRNSGLLEEACQDFKKAKVMGILKSQEYIEKYCMFGAKAEK